MTKKVYNEVKTVDLGGFLKAFLGAKIGLFGH